MTDYDALCARLTGRRIKSTDIQDHLIKYQSMCDEAADAIAALVAQNRYLVGKLDCKAALIDGLRQTVEEERARAEAAEARVAALEAGQK